VLTPVPAAVAATFIALAAAMLAVWAPRVSASPHARVWWLAPFAASLLLAVGAGVVESWGLVALVVLVATCRVGEEAPDGWLRGFALALMLAMSAALLAHLLPGFHNPRVLDAVRLSPDAAPYTKFLNLDKGALGLLLLTLHAPARVVRRAIPGSMPGALWRFAVVALVTMTLTVTAGFARWDPKVPAWWPLWLGSMVFLTALPEEALFRHVVQGGLEARLGASRHGRWISVTIAGVLFGLAHVGGGWIYAGLAAIAGVGYGWVFAVTGSFAAALAAHTGLNLLHLLFFSYPALAAAMPSG
jgi:membrane protease YdiL (CAAX protease family)